MEMLVGQGLHRALGVLKPTNDIRPWSDTAKVASQWLDLPS